MSYPLNTKLMRTFRLFSTLLILGSIFSSIFLVTPRPAAAADVTFTVTSFADVVDSSQTGCTVTVPSEGTQCTLRQAVRAATRTPAGRTIAINLRAGVYNLTLTGTGERESLTGDLNIRRSNIIINGAGKGVTIIDGGAIEHVFRVESAGGIVTLTLNDLTIRNGRAPSGSGGGGIFVRHGNLVLNNVEILNNTALGGVNSGSGGGGILIADASGDTPTSNINTLTANNITVSGNVVQRNSLSGNGGGGISILTNAVATIRNSQITNNTTASRGGGLYIDGNTTSKATVTLENVQIENNRAENPTYTRAVAANDTNNDRPNGRNGGGILNLGDLTFTGGTLKNNVAQVDGGGMYAFDATTLIDGVDVWENIALYRKGGGFYNYAGILTIRNSDLYANEARTIPFGLQNAYPVLDNFAFPAGGLEPNTTNPTRLDSNRWSVRLNSAGDGLGRINFGGSMEAIPLGEDLNGLRRTFQRSYARGDVFRGGLYGFEVEPGNTALGFQPVTNFYGDPVFAPNAGNVRLRLQNTTGSNITSYTVNYDIWTLNNAQCASHVDFVYNTATTSTPSGTGDGTYIDTVFDPGFANRYASTGGVNPPNPNATNWVRTPKSLTVTGLNVPSSGDNWLHLRWNVYYASGCTSTQQADQVAIDNVVVTANSQPLLNANFNTYARTGFGNVEYPVYYHGVGGAVANDFGGTLLFFDSTVRGNTAVMQGGGVYNIGNNNNDENATVVLNNTTFRDNAAPGAWLRFYTDQNPKVTGQGGGIYNEGKTELYNSSMFNNSTATDGGGFYNNGRLVLANSLVDSNAALYTQPDGSALGNGGGIANYFSGILTINDSMIINNEANNRGGGIDTLSGNPVTINNSTIANNTAYLGDGGGIYNTARTRVGGGDNRRCCDWSSTLTLNNVTVSSNLAGNRGGGIYQDVEVDISVWIRITNGTIVDNFAQWNGGGLHFDFSSTNNNRRSWMRNTLVANNQVGAAGGGAQCAGSQQIGSGELTADTAKGFNIISDSSCTNASVAKDDLIGVNVTYNALANNLGPKVGASSYERTLLTHKLTGGESNPALNRIPTASSSNGCPTTDARGFPRPRTTADQCDVGAYEISPPVAVNDSVSTPIATAITFDVTTNDFAPDGVIIANTVAGPLISPDPLPTVQTSPILSNLVTRNQAGRLVNNGDGTFTFTPRYVGMPGGATSGGSSILTDFEGLLTFRYQVRDDSGALSQPGFVFVYVGQDVPPQVAECLPPDDQLVSPWGSLDIGDAAIRPGRSVQELNGAFATVCGAG
ncbi:MAG: hypothetical protein HC911_04760, partial [Chloroflexaceae bacterium]|nr:hypothetical protein [Chloroflexaceae bacterium]